MEISYILVGFNSGRFVPTCLRSIHADAPADSEILFIDNASSDGTVEQIQNDFPSVRLIRNDTNVGHCKATNQGLVAARGDFMMVLDTDTELPPGTTRTLLDFFAAHPRADVAAPRMLNPDGSIQETARRFPTMANALFGRQTFLAQLFPNNPFTRRYLGRENLDRTDPFEVDWVSAACMVFRRATIDRTGLWDEGFGGYWVDCDWCKCVREKAGTIWCVPSARVWHYEQNRIGVRKSVHRIRLFNQGAQRYYVKHHTRGRWDPRALLTGLLMSLRTGIQILMNLLAKPPSRTIAAPPETQPAASSPPTTGTGTSDG